METRESGRGGGSVESAEPEKIWGLVLRVLDQYYLFRLLGSYLDAETLASLYLALPPARRDAWFCRRHLAHWGRRHASHHRTRLRLDAGSTLLDMGSFLGFRHLYDHARWGVWNRRCRTLDAHGAVVQDPMVGGVPPYGGDNGDGPYPFRIAYLTYLFRSHPMQKSSYGAQHLMVRACLFMPARGPPPPFAGCLVVLGVGGHLIFYAPTEAGFETVASLQLDCSPHSLACSPRGTALLAAHDNAVFLDLSDHRVRCIFTGVCVEQRRFLRQCFTSEDAFLTADEAGNVWEHGVTRGGPLILLWPPRLARSGGGCGGGRGGSTVTTRLLLDHRDYAPNGWPFFHGDTKTDLAAAYKPATPDTRSCLFLAGIRAGGGMGSVLRLAFSPERGKKGKQRKDLFANFPHALIAALDVHPSHERAYVVVITTQTREGFFSAPPELSAGVQPRENEPRFDELVTGVLGVYELQFPGGGRVRALPRYFLDECPRTSHPVTQFPVAKIRLLPASHRRAYRLYTARCLKQGWKIQVQARCSRTHLTLRLDRHTLAHIPLVSTGDGTVVCQGLEMDFRVFAFSEHHSFGAVFGAGSGSKFHAALAACGKYQRFFPDAYEIQRPEKAVLVQHCHAIPQDMPE